MTAQHFFKENQYVILRNFIPADTTLLLYHYCLNQTLAIDYKIFNDNKCYDPDWDGKFSDAQAPGAYSRYGDPLMDSLLYLCLDKIKDNTGLELNPNYSYWRLYQHGNVLKRHIDRPSCEISTTLCLGYNVSNVDQDMYPDYTWPIWVKSNNTEIPIDLRPGDMLIYRGCDIDHWREKYLGLNHAQVFLHFSDANGPYKNINDGRPRLGLPKKVGNGDVNHE
jgi:hypothetical protein